MRTKHLVYRRVPPHVNNPAMVTEGRLSRRALSLVLEWASEHRAELRTNWAPAEAHRQLNRIDPLL